MPMSRKVRRLGSLGRGRTRDAVPPSSAVPFVVPAVPAAAADERPEPCLYRFEMMRKQKQKQVFI